MTTYPTAHTLLTRIEHCSGCGETTPDETDGLSDCCSARVCRPDGTAQDFCCAAVELKAEQEAAEGRPSLPVGPPAGRETVHLREVSEDANLMSRPGGKPPADDDTREPRMARSSTPKESQATRAVFRHLQKDAEGSIDPVGRTFGTERATFEKLAKEYLSDKSRLSSKTIQGADWDAVFAYFCADDTPAADGTPAADEPEEEPGKPELPAPAPAPAAKRRGRREAIGEASAPGWDLLYDKPKSNCEVGRRYSEAGKPEYALICKEHGYVYPVPRLTAERAIRAAGRWCAECTSA